MENEAQKKREGLINKIKAILARTTENGCTEEEAMTAMRLARNLMDTHGVTELDLKANMSDMRQQQYTSARKFKRTIAFGMAHWLSKYCDVEAYVSNNNTSFERWHVFGSAADRELYLYLHDSLTAFVDRNATDYAKQQIRKLIELGQKPDQNATINAWRSFATGCSNRIGARLKSLVEERDGVKMNDGRALVVVKSAMVKQAMDEAGIRLGRNTRQNGGSDAAAYNEGHRAGDRASFSRGIGSSQSGTLAITGR